MTTALFRKERWSTRHRPELSLFETCICHIDVVRYHWHVDAPHLTFCLTLCRRIFACCLTRKPHHPMTLATVMQPRIAWNVYSNPSLSQTHVKPDVDNSDRFRPPKTQRLNASTPASWILVKPDKKLPPEVSALMRDYCRSCCLLHAAKLRERAPPQSRTLTCSR